MPRQPRPDAPGTDVKVVSPDWGSGLGGEGNKKRREACRVGFAIREAAEEDIGKNVFVLAVGGEEDGISGRGGGTVFRCNDIGSNPSGLFGGTA